jgi:hypothetical protein
MKILVLYDSFLPVTVAASGIRWYVGEAQIHEEYGGSDFLDRFDIGQYEVVVTGDIGGLDIIEQVRHSGYRGRVVFTGNGNLKDMALTAGADVCLGKPFSDVSLADAVKGF